MDLQNSVEGYFSSSDKIEGDIEIKREPSDWCPPDHEIDLPLENPEEGETDINVKKEPIAVNVYLKSEVKKGKKEINTVDANERCASDSEFVPCYRCNKRFSIKKGLLKNCEGERKILLCNICGKHVSQTNNKFIVVPVGSRPFACNLCTDSFPRRDQLNKHVIMHSGIPCFKCDQCYVSFTNKDNWKRHSALHLDLRRYKCSQCDKTYSKQWYLDKHLLVHAGLRPFKCDRCGKSFYQKSTLTKHIALYCGSKTFKCDYCNRTFSARSNLEAHALIHSRFACTCCGKSFKTKECLDSHVSVHPALKL